MHAAAIVTDHSTQRVVVVGGRVRPEHQPMRPRRILEAIKDAARLHARGSRRRIDLDDVVQVPGEIDAHGDVAGLAGKARSSAPGNNRRVMFAADAYRFDHLVPRPGADDADRHLAVVRGVGRIERPRLRPEVHRCPKRAFEIAPQSLCRVSRVAVVFEQDLPVQRPRDEPRLCSHHTSSRTVSEPRVSAVFIACGVPLARASAMCSACFASIFGGSGGS